MPIPSYNDLGGKAVLLSIDEPSVPPGMSNLGIVVTNPNLVTINPTATTEIGTHTIKVILTDDCGDSLLNDLTVVVINTAPIFTVTALPLVQTYLGSSKDFFIT